MEITLIGVALWALVPGLMAKKKGRSFWGYYFLSLLITPLITIIIVACLSQKTDDDSLDEHINPSEIYLTEDILCEFSNYPEECIKVVCGWIIGWRNKHEECKYSTLDYLRALERCGNGRKQRNALQICQNIYEEKMLFEKSNIDHMMKHLNDVVNCASEEDRIKSEDAVIYGLEAVY